jgi:tyrosine-protein kinase
VPVPPLGPLMSLCGGNGQRAAARAFAGPAPIVMTSGTSEALKDAVRRALPLVVVLYLLGAVALFAVRQVEGPRHQASAHVFISTTNLAATLAGTQLPYIDPRRTIDNAIALASSGELFDRVADATGGDLGSASELREATEVSGSTDNDVLVFTATADDADRAVRIANAVADEYPDYRADISLRDIDRAVSQLHAELEQSPDDPVLTQKAEQLELLQTLNSGDATVIERADAATKVNPRPLRDALLGGALGFVVALLLAGAREALNTRVRSEADVEQLLDSPVLASIQTLPKRTRLVTLGGRHTTQPSDTYALLAANLMHIRGDSPSTTLAVTSALKGEGKTTTAANLAIAFARRGAKVILVDFDVRKPSLAVLFGLPPGSPGILQMVKGDVGPPETLWPVPLNGSRPAGDRDANGRPAMLAVAPAEGEGSLHVVPAGGSVKAGALSQSPRVAEVLDRLKEQADILILDTPPALLTAEMAELSPNVDMVLVVARQGHVTRRGLQTLSKRAQAWQTEVVGAVVTGTPAEERSGYYGE